ncbi:putative membrane protein, partial [Yersinia pestis PY-66]
MAWLYISLSVVSLFFYYYVVSHLLYSKNIYLNISSL